MLQIGKSVPGVHGQANSRLSCERFHSRVNAIRPCASHTCLVGLVTGGISAMVRHLGYLHFRREASTISPKLVGSVTVSRRLVPLLPCKRNMFTSKCARRALIIHRCILAPCDNETPTKNSMLFDEVNAYRLGSSRYRLYLKTR